jgi:hypothetical protein
MSALTLLSVPSMSDGKRLYALLPETSRRALRRAQSDDPIWTRSDVRQEWTMAVDVERTRLRPSRAAKFWVA